MTSSGLGFLMHKISNDINSVSTSQQPFNMINLPDKIKNIKTSHQKISSPRKMKRDTSMTNFMKFSWAWSI
jgi:hypothetical protein